MTVSVHPLPSSSLLLAACSCSRLVGLTPLPAAPQLRQRWQQPGQQQRWQQQQRQQQQQRPTRAAAGPGQPPAVAAAAAVPEEQQAQQVGFLGAVVRSVQAQFQKLDGLWDK